jgi:monoamine oxidase
LPILAIDHGTPPGDEACRPYESLVYRSTGNAETFDVARCNLPGEDLRGSGGGVNGESMLDVAIVGAGAGGTYLADRLAGVRPEWTITIFERSSRIGGRLRSVLVDTLAHPIELGGMRYLTSHPRVQSVVTELAIPTRPFDVLAGQERSYLRGRIGGGPSDPGAGSGYDLPPEERDRSAIELTVDAFERIVPGARDIAPADWPGTRARVAYLDRPVTDWSLGDALATIRSPEGHRFIRDAFGYDSGFNPHNAGDAIQYLLGGNDPSTEARVPVEGMDRIPRALAARFEERGGTIALGKDARHVSMDDGVVRLEFADGSAIRARRLVLAIPVSALTGLVDSSPTLGGQAWRQLLGSVEGFQATKLYCWYERPWWREGAAAPTGIRSTTDLSNRMLFYFDHDRDGPAAMLAAFNDHRHAEPLIHLARGASDGAPAPAPLLDEITSNLRAIHPGAVVPRPIGSAFMHWGSDPREIAWTFWRAGADSDEAMVTALQPDADAPIHVCGETFSRAQAWAEGALATAHELADKLLEDHEH